MCNLYFHFENTVVNKKMNCKVIRDFKQFIFPTIKINFDSFHTYSILLVV